MILDAALDLAVSQALTGGASTTTDYYDAGAPIHLTGAIFDVVVHAKGGTSPWLTVTIVGSNSPAFSPETALGFISIATADFLAGSIHRVKASTAGAFRYYRLKYSLNGTVPTATVSARITLPEWTAEKHALAGG